MAGDARADEDARPAAATPGDDESPVHGEDTQVRPASRELRRAGRHGKRGAGDDRVAETAAVLLVEHRARVAAGQPVGPRAGRVPAELLPPVREPDAADRPREELRLTGLERRRSAGRAAGRENRRRRDGGSSPAGHEDEGERRGRCCEPRAENEAVPHGTPPARAALRLDPSPEAGRRGDGCTRPAYERERAPLLVEEGSVLRAAGNARPKSRAGRRVQ